MSKFNTVLESFYPSTMKLITRVRYPKQIQFSEEFITSLKKEFARLQTLEENSDTELKPIRNYREKFLKAVNFCVSNL